MKKNCKKNIKNFLILIITFFCVIISCDNDHEYGFKPNAVQTMEFKDVNQTNAIVSGKIVSNGGKELTERGICWHTSANPVITNNKKTSPPYSLGELDCLINNLLPGTKYYVRAYARNSSGTAYGNELSFITNPATIPIISSTKNATSISQTTASSGGIISSDGAANIIAKGVCWKTTQNPSINDPKTTDGIGTASFNSIITGLLPNTTYYVRAYATNSVGTAYGNQITFTTLAPTIPTIQTTAISSITQTTASSGGNITDNGGAAVTSRGVCWSNINSNPTIANSFTNNGNGNGTFTSALTGLNPGTTYYLRAYATNSVGTAYGNLITFTTTAATIPTGVTTSNITSTTQVTASCGGNVTGTGGAAITQKGVCWSNTTSSPTISNPKTIDGSGVGTFTSSITGLNPSTTYYVRAYATNSVGTAYGTTRSFTTSGAVIPTVTSTTPVTSITSNSAVSGGTVSSTGGANVTARGVCWSNTNSNPTIANSLTNSGTGVGTFTSNLQNLNPNTLYYVRAYATNSVGTGYGNVVTFTSSPPPLAVGQSYLGGVIGYIYQPGDIGYINGEVHGIIATTSNQSSGITWGCSGISISGTSINLGAGSNNTTLIVNGCSTNNIAARLCFNLSSGGYTDWVLPSTNELSRLYTNRLAIGGFNNVSYWTSTQLTSTTARSINFSTGVLNSTTKTSSLYVRAIRYF